MKQHNVQPRTQKAILEKIKDGLFEVEITKGEAFFVLNHRRFEFRGTGMVSVNQPTNPN